MAQVHVPETEKKFRVRKYFSREKPEVSFGNEPAFNAANLVWGIALIFLLAALMSMFAGY